MSPTRDGGRRLRATWAREGAEEVASAERMTSGLAVGEDALEVGPVDDYVSPLIIVSAPVSSRS